MAAGGSNFKRTNTVDAATIKENSPRYGGGVRPSTAVGGGAAGGATPTKSSAAAAAAAADRTTSPKGRITKSNTMSTATGRTMLGQAQVNNRR